MAGNAFSGRRGKLKAVDNLSVSAGAGRTVTVPRWLDTEASVLFSQLSGELSALGLFSALDREALAQYCDAVAQYRELTLKIRALNAREADSGDLQSTESGYQQITAWHTLRNQAQKRSDDLGKQFGFTPLARRALQDQIKALDAGDSIAKKYLTG